MKKSWWKVSLLQLSGVLYVLLLLLVPESASSQYDRDLINRQRRNDEALQQLRSIKRRVSYRYVSKRRKTLECRDWNQYCVPWSSEYEQTCCNPRRLVCRCNLWMQNCRCVSRAWGK
ncbi:uncharacterized protein [Haliotis cracherodii]|uniref:uncharacterized protein n=1 Tax=Haliotis cracherodii TaxID=6455 RepID=UPI0039EC2BBA